MPQLITAISPSPISSIMAFSPQGICAYTFDKPPDTVADNKARAPDRFIV